MSKEAKTFSPKPSDIEVAFSPGGWTRECNHTYYETTAWHVRLAGVEDFDMNVFYEEHEGGYWDILMGMNYIQEPGGNTWEDYVTACVDSDESINVHQTAHMASAAMRENLVDQIATSPIEGAENFLRMLNAWDAYLLDAWDDSWLGRADEPRTDD